MHRLYLLALCTLLTAGASAQHEHSPYAEGEHAKRSLPALSDAEVASLLAGEGMGFALPAELNGYPGPKHVLELTEGLALTEVQVAETQALFERMKARAVELGEQLVGIEGHLNASFQEGQIDAESLARMTGHAADLRGQLRAVHLGAHLEMMDILTDAQITEYSLLRGYTQP